MSPGQQLVKSKASVRRNPTEKRIRNQEGSRNTCKQKKGWENSMLGNTNKVASTRRKRAGRKGEQGAGETDQWRDQDLGHT